MKEIINYWNEAFKGIEPLELKNEDITIDTTFEQAIVEFSKNAQYVLDYGCGATLNLFLLEVHSPSLVQAIGIDPANNAIEFLNKTKDKSNFKKLEYKVGDLKVLDSVPHHFDYIICSNVLDCVPLIETGEIIRKLTKRLNKGGIFLLKVNFYLDEVTAIKYGLTPMGNNAYSSNGIFRIAFYNDDFWIGLFKDLGLTLIKKDYFQRNPTGPKDRIFIFKK